MRHCGRGSGCSQCHLRRPAEPIGRALRYRWLAANAGLDFRIFPHLMKVFSRDAGLAELYNRSQNLTIFDFKKCYDLEMGSKVTHSHWEWYHSIDGVWFRFLLVFICNFVPKMHRFWDIRLQKCHDLETRVRGPSRSLQMLPCDRAHMTSYWRSIVSMALSHAVSEIFNVEKCRDFEIGVRGHSRSLKAVPFGTLCMVSY